MVYRIFVMGKQMNKLHWGVSQQQQKRKPGYQYVFYNTFFQGLRINQDANIHI